MKSTSEKVAEPENLISSHLLEIGKDRSVLWTWSYPSLDNRLRRLCVRKVNVLLSLRKSEDEWSEGLRICKYFHFDKQWFYVYIAGYLSPTSAGQSSSQLSEIRQVGVLIGTSDFNPEKYELVGEILFQSYLKTEDPSGVLQQFLSLVVDGKCMLPKKKTFTLSQYDTSNPFRQHRVKDMISRFGLESILVYTALTRRRRIVVYHYDIDVLMEVILSMPALVRDSGNLWDVIYPWMDLAEEEISYLTNIPFYVMGCTHAGVEQRSDLYDIFVNIPAAEISVASHAKEAVSMNKTHKEMALFMVQLANNEEISEEEVVEEIFRKSHDLVDKAPMQKAQT